MLSVQDLKMGDKIDALDDEGDWWSATVCTVAPKRKKPYVDVSWDEFPSLPEEKIYEEDGRLRERKSRAVKKAERFERCGGSRGRNPDGTYEVERIVAERKVNGISRYKLRWRYWSAKWDEWQQERFVADDLIKEWQRSRRKLTKSISKRARARVLKSYVMLLPDEPDDAAALRRSEAQGDVNDLALDAIEVLKGTKKAVAKKRLQRKTGFSARRFLALHKYLRSLIVTGEEDGTPDELEE